MRSATISACPTPTCTRWKTPLTEGTAALALSSVACARGGRLLFEGVELELAAGGAALVLGPNGAGKSSLLRLVAGLLPLVAGRVEVRGAVAWMGEAPALDAELPLAKALGFWARIDGVGADTVAAALDRMGLAPLAEVPVRMLSTGQRRRAALARVMASGAPNWLLDEPAAGLDAKSLGALEAAIAEHRESGGVVLAATHQPFALPDAQTITLGGAS